MQISIFLQAPSSYHFPEQRNRLYFYYFYRHSFAFQYKLGHFHKKHIINPQNSRMFLYVYLTHCLFTFLIYLRVKIKY